MHKTASVGKSEIGQPLLTVVCWRWSTPGYRSQFGPESVNALSAMVARNYPAPHRFVCCTNDAKGIAGHVEIVSDRADWSHIRSPHGAGNPSCYRRLRLFAPDAAETFGERVVSLDLDCVIVGDLRPLWDRPESFVGWQDPLYPRQLNGSMQMLRTGAHPEVWDGFNPARSPSLAKAAGFVGSDQGWLSYCLPDAARWTAADGVYSFRKDCAQGLPDGARIVFFHGKVDPWSAQAQALPWVRENWR